MKFKKLLVTSLLAAFMAVMSTSVGANRNSNVDYQLETLRWCADFIERDSTVVWYNPMTWWNQPSIWQELKPTFDEVMMEKEVSKAYGISAHVSKLEQARTIEEVAKIVAEEKPKAERHFYKLLDAFGVIERRAFYGYCQFNPEWTTCEARMNSNPPSTRSGALGAIIEEERVKFQQLSKSPEEIWNELQRKRRDRAWQQGRST